MLFVLDLFLAKGTLRTPLCWKFLTHPSFLLCIVVVNPGKGMLILTKVIVYSRFLRTCLSFEEYLKSKHSFICRFSVQHDCLELLSLSGILHLGDLNSLALKALKTFFISPDTWHKGQ